MSNLFVSFCDIPGHIRRHPAIIWTLWRPHKHIVPRPHFPNLPDVKIPLSTFCLAQTLYSVGFTFFFSSYNLQEERRRKHQICLPPRQSTRCPAWSSRFRPPRHCSTSSARHPPHEFYSSRPGVHGQSARKSSPTSDSWLSNSGLRRLIAQLTEV
jgi:hypothetical protein